MMHGQKNNKFWTIGYFPRNNRETLQQGAQLSDKLMFCWPCNVIYPYNMKQEDALFSIDFF